MLRETLLGTITLFSVYTAFYVLIPVWNSFGNASTSAFNSAISDTTYQNNFASMASNFNIVIQYSFVIVVLGIFAYMLLLAWFREPDTGRL